MTTKDSPFITFWRAIGEQLRLNGLPDLTYGPARRLYDATMQEARTEAQRALHAKRTA